MVQARKKNRRPKKRKSRRIIFLVVSLGVILSLVFFFLRTKPVEKVEKRVVQRMPPPPPPVAKESREQIKEKEEVPPPSVWMALIIDDGGYNMKKFKEMIGMGRPMTFAILPNTPHGREAALMAHEDGAEVMLHLPMEPRESNRYSLEKDTVLAGMDKKEIQAIMKRDLAQIPQVRGVSNHMGSKATEDVAVMRALLEILKEDGLYFIDSHTSPHTVGPRVARQVGVAFGSNDRFIDNEKDLKSIKEAIRWAIERARKDGKAIAIGHPHPLTAQAIREMIPEIEGAGIKLVFASEVAK
jgi:polysaccharide deacetylase 2 family uncharacterized protein YibQ